MESHTFLFILLLLLPFVECAYECFHDDECSLNGRCNFFSYRCICDPGWTGDDCGALDLLPATRSTGYNRTAEGISSWGGKVIRDPYNATLYHLFVAEFTHGCGLDYWNPYSRIIRATSNKPDGPYKFAEEVVPTFAHNPSVIYSEFHKLWIMDHIGCPQTVPDTCHGVRSTCDAGNTVNGESGISIRVAKELTGEWRDIGIVLGSNGATTWDYDTTNPSAFPLNNGSVVLAYRGCPYQCGGEELINIAYSDDLNGPYRRLHSSPVFPNPNEDPFIWQDTHGHWHMLMHSLEPDGGFYGGPNIGRHAFARTFEGPWTFWNRTLAFNTTAAFTDGTRVAFYRRERPQLFFNSQGYVQYLITGVQERGRPESYTFIQPIRSG